VSFGENRQRRVPREINHSGFLLTIAQNPGKTPQTRGQPEGFDPKNPHLAAEIHFLLATDIASDLEQKVNI